MYSTPTRKQYGSFCFRNSTCSSGCSQCGHSGVSVDSMNSMVSGTVRLPATGGKSGFYRGGPALEVLGARTLLQYDPGHGLPRPSPPATLEDPRGYTARAGLPAP